MGPKKQNILIIKHGALGDLIKTMGAFRVLRRYHSNAKITLLTAPAFRSFCLGTGYFDEVLEDCRSRNPVVQIKLLNYIHRLKFDLIYDLQGSARTGRYFWYLNFRRPTPWSGNIKGCQFYQPRIRKKQLHPYERLADQLMIAGVPLDQNAILPTFEWIKANVARFNLPKNFILLIPGSSPHTGAKRWPAPFYGEIARRLWESSYSSVIIGSSQEKSLAQEIKKICPHSIDLTGQTEFCEIFSVANKATLVLGNDTGPTFLAAATGKPSIVLWSDYCKVGLNAPRGDNVFLLQEPCLKNLSLNRVWQTIASLLKKHR